MPEKKKRPPAVRGPQDVINELKDEAETRTQKLKLCRAVLRAHGLGHLYPGVDALYEKDYVRAMGEEIDRGIKKGEPHAFQLQNMLLHDELAKSDQDYAAVVELLNLYRDTFGIIEGDEYGELYAAYEKSKTEQTERRAARAGVLTEQGNSLARGSAAAVRRSGRQVGQELRGNIEDYCGAEDGGPRSRPRSYRH